MNAAAVPIAAQRGIAANFGRFLWERLKFGGRTVRGVLVESTAAVVELATAQADFARRPVILSVAKDLVLHAGF